MGKFTSLVVSAAAMLLVTSTSASAVITTFAQFANAQNGRNVRWVNNGTTTSNGTGGRFYTTSSGSATAPGNAATDFKFQGVLSSLGFIKSNFFMDITVASGNPATTGMGAFTQNIPGSLVPLSPFIGKFSFISTQAITMGSNTYGPGVNLLSGEFTSGSITGSGTSGSFFGDTNGSTLVYTSDFLNFSNTTSRDFSMGLTAINQSLLRSITGGPKALRSFRAFANGSFSSDPAPVVVGIPEPEVWGLLVVGFGLVGLQVRRRNRPASVVA